MEEMGFGPVSCSHGFIIDKLKTSLYFNLDSKMELKPLAEICGLLIDH